MKFFIFVVLEDGTRESGLSLPNLSNPTLHHNASQDALNPLHYRTVIAGTTPTSTLPGASQQERDRRTIQDKPYPMTAPHGETRTPGKHLLRITYTPSRCNISNGHIPKDDHSHTLHYQVIRYSRMTLSGIVARHYFPRIAA